MVPERNGVVNAPASRTGGRSRLRNTPPRPGPHGPPDDASPTVDPADKCPTALRSAQASEELDFDEQVEQMLCFIKPSPVWGPVRVHEFTKELFEFMVSFRFPDVFPAQEVFDGVFEHFRRRLKSHKHHVPTIKQCREQFRNHAELSGHLEFKGSERQRDSGGSRGCYEMVSGPGDDAPDDPSEWGYYKHQDGHSRQLTNFDIALDRQVKVMDDLTPTQRFEGRLRIAGREEPFGIDTAAYANDPQLRAAVYAAAGPQAQIHCKMDELRNAIGSGPRPVTTTITTNFGWDATGTKFLVPTGVVTADGFHPHADGDTIRVDLANQGTASHLGLRPLQPGELDAAKRHIVTDLLRIHDRRVTYALLGTAALAVLYGHTEGMGRYALWLKGLTGAGKSFTAKLFANLFGNFPISSGRFATWAATPNFVQNQGYFFRDALYLVDDFKPDVTRNDQVVRVIQAYADNVARGRLSSKSVANPTREIRGTLVSTAEDLPEHAASTMARLVVVNVPEQAKEIDRGQRCLQQAAGYSGVMADFIRFTLADGWTSRFAGAVQTIQQRLLSGLPNRQNDARVASNLALLGAGFRVACEYLRDVWPEAQAQDSEFTETDLIALRNESLSGARDQQASEVFLHTLAGLVEHKRVKIEGWASHDHLSASVPIVGRVAPPSRSSGSGTVFSLCTSLCLEEVNRSLKTQGRSIVAATEKGLLDQLHGDNKLLAPGLTGNGTERSRSSRPSDTSPSGRRATTQITLSIGNRRGFLIAADVLFGEGNTGS